jgi:hypothetical protein
LASTLDSANSYKGWEVSYDGAYANGSIAVYLINIDPSNAIELIFSGFTAISANTMHHVVFSYDGSKSASGVMVCMDGTCKTSASSTIANNLTGSSSNTIDMLLGKRTDGTNFLSGTLSDIRIYNYKLSSTQVSSLFSAGIQ